MDRNKMVRKYIENGHMSTLYRVLLVIWDAVCINACSYMALFYGMT